MAIIYLDCSNKEATGDMLAASLLELYPAPQQVLANIQALLPNLLINSYLEQKEDLNGRILNIKVANPQNTFNLEQISLILNPLNPALKDDIWAVLHILFEKNSLLSTANPHLIEQQELAIIMINCYLFTHLEPQKVIAHTPNGITEHITDAILKYYIDQYDYRPPMQIFKSGYGFSHNNHILAHLGELKLNSRQLIKLSSVITDITPAKINFLLTELLANEAIEAYTQYINTPNQAGGQLLICICALPQKLRIIDIIFKHSNILSLDEQIIERYNLKQQNLLIDSPYGQLSVIKNYGFGIEHYDFDQQDLNSLAHELDLSLNEIENILYNALKKTLT